ncbi:MAG: host attachment protein [Beijerinckiaceae bacterium]|nr:MAG: host attachment protein [Beijerinckiaceae bacterium]
MHTRVRNRDWMVVCDDRKAIILENEGDAEYPILAVREVMEHASLANRDLDSDKPGRVWESATTARSAIEPADHHDLDEQSFLSDVAERLDALLAASRLQHLIMVAPPRALGVLRKLYSPALRSAIRAEVDQDLVKAPVGELEGKFAVR